MEQKGRKNEKAQEKHYTQEECPDKETLSF